MENRFFAKNDIFCKIFVTKVAILVTNRQLLQIVTKVALFVTKPHLGDSSEATLLADIVTKVAIFVTKVLGVFHDFVGSEPGTFDVDDTMHVTEMVLLDALNCDNGVLAARI